MLAMAATRMGRDQLALEAIASARQLAEDLLLFGADPQDAKKAGFSQMSASKYRSYAYAAWSTYSWLTLHCLFFHERPIAYPPLLPIPGDLEVNCSYTPPGSWPALPVAWYTGHTFQEICKLCTIVQEVMAVYLDRGDGTKIPLAFAAAKFLKVLDWARTLEKHVASSYHAHSHSPSLQ
jgi:hypothetical protein